MKLSQLDAIRIGLVLTVWVCGSAAAAAARRPVAVLAFGGTAGPKVRGQLIHTLKRRYEIIDGQVVLDASDELGIPMTRGRNLARVARQAGVVAVVGGAVGRGYLSLAVYSAKSGDVVSSGRIRCRARLGRKQLREALTVILKGLRKCPKKPAAPRPAPRARSAPPPPKPKPTPTPTPKPKPTPTPTPGSGSDLTYDPSAVLGGGKKGGATGTAGSDGLSAGVEENPLEGPGEAAESGDSEAATRAKPAPDPHGSPRIEATVGLGIWMRSLSFNQLSDTSPASNHDTGKAIALGGTFRARPLAFFLDNRYLASVYTRVGFQTTVGLESSVTGQDDSGTVITGTAATSLWELRCEVLGYDWNLLDRLQSPHLEFGLGFGMTDVSFDWGGLSSSLQPGVAYKYMLFSFGGYMPIMSTFGAHARFDYRLVTTAGELEDDKWFGGSSAGGISFLVGGYVTLMGIIARVSYGYTRYFHDFIEAETRLSENRPKDCVGAPATCKLVAGGALDVLHSFMIDLGYGF